MAGFTWKEVEACIVNGVHRIIIVTCILFLVGTLIGVWIQAGVIPLFLYWGLKLLSPSMFLVSTVLICAVFSLMTGTSFGTIGTAGLALLGVGEALGFPHGDSRAGPGDHDAARNKRQSVDERRRCADQLRRHNVGRATEGQHMRRVGKAKNEVQ